MTVSITETRSIITDAIINQNVIILSIVDIVKMLCELIFDEKMHSVYTALK